MKSFSPMDHFIMRAAGDGKLLPSHISLFIAIFFYCPSSDISKVFQVCRKKLMRLSKIRSNATYHKCISELDSLGYISYSPSYDPFRGSQIQIITGANG